MSAFTIALSLLAACTSGEDTKDTDTPVDNKFSENSYVVSDLLSTYNNPAQTPVDIAAYDTTSGDDTIPTNEAGDEFQYVTNDFGITNTGDSEGKNAAGWYKYAIFWPDINSGEKYDAPMALNEAGDVEYVDINATPPARSLSLELTGINLLHHGELEKDGTGEDLEASMILGSPYISATAIDSSDPAIECLPASPVPYISDELKAFSPWFDAFSGLSSQIPTPQNNIGMQDNIPWLPIDAVHTNMDGFTDLYAQNFPCAFYSDGQSNPYKSECGTNSVSLDMSGIVFATVPESVWSAGPMCFRSYESDAPLFGATYFFQQGLDLGKIVDTTEAAGMNSFKITMAHKLDDEKSGYIALCDTDGNSLADVFGTNFSDAFVTGNSADGHSLFDISDEICGTDIGDIDAETVAEFLVTEN